MSVLMDKHIELADVPKLWMHFVNGVIKRNWLNQYVDAPNIIPGPLLFQVEDSPESYDVTVGDYTTKQITTFSITRQSSED